MRSANVADYNLIAYTDFTNKHSHEKYAKSLMHEFAPNILSVVILTMSGKLFVCMKFAEHWGTHEISLYCYILNSKIIEISYI